MNPTRRKDIKHLEAVPLVPFFSYVQSLKIKGTFESKSLMTLKTDGVSIKFGRNMDGLFFMETARSGVVYNGNAFTIFAIANGKDLALAEKYSVLFNYLEYFVDQTFPQVLWNFKVCSEVLFNKMGEVRNKDTIKFIHLTYSFPKLGEILTIFPYAVQYDDGTSHFYTDSIMKKMLNNSNEEIMVCNPRLDCSAVELPQIIRVLWSYDYDIQEHLEGEPNTRLPLVYQKHTREAAVELRDSILVALHSGKIPGYYSTGPAQEGVVVTTKHLTFKVTEPAFREMIKK